MNSCTHNFPAFYKIIDPYIIANLHRKDILGAKAVHAWNISGKRMWQRLQNTCGLRMVWSCWMSFHSGGEPARGDVART